MGIGFGGKYWSRSSPGWAKWTLIGLIYIITKTVVNMDDLPFDTSGMFWKMLRFYSAEILAGLAFLKEMMGKKNANDKAEDYQNKIR